MARTSKRTPAAGPSKVNIAGELEIDVTLKAWQLYTGKNAKQLKNWVIDTVLPSIPVFLEWSRGVKAANVNRQKKKRMGQLTRTAVVEAMLDDLSPVQMPSEDFVQSGGLNVVSVWAHTAHIVRDHLEAIPECGKTFKDDNQWACAAFDFLKFIVKNSAEGRPFQSGKITAADNKRIAFVLETGWDLSNWLARSFSKPTSSLSSTSSSSSIASPGTRSRSNTSSQQDIPDITEATVRAEWGAKDIHPVPMPHTRSADCSLDTFKDWATTQFKMKEAGHELRDVIVQVDPEADDAQVVTTNTGWERAIRRALAKQTGDTEISVFCTSLPQPRPCIKWTEKEHFVDLDYTAQDPHSSSPDKVNRLAAYTLSQVRSSGNSRCLLQPLIKYCLENRLVSRRSVVEASAADLNFESTNLDEQDNCFGMAKSPAFDLVQDWLATPNEIFNDEETAREFLQQELGEDAEIIHRLPNRRSADPAEPRRVRQGNTHKPHQVCFLFWALNMEWAYQAIFCCDGCGMGKTHEYTAYLEASTLFWERRGEPMTGPTLVVCPSTLLEKTYLCLQDQLGVGWNVYQYGQGGGPSRERVSFDPRHFVYTSPKASRSVVVVSYPQLQSCTNAPQDRKNRDGLFDRIILDEAQAIRGCDQTKQGQILKSFNARFKALFTGSPVVDSILDFEGYLSFLQHPFWSSNEDLNMSETNKNRSRYARFMETLETDDKSQLDSDSELNSRLSWDSDCDSLTEWSEEDAQELVNNGWKCSHWPALIKHNGNRAASMERETKKKINGKSVSVDIGPPFEDNPFDLYHPKNKNHVKCFSTAAFKYYIRPHLTKSRLEADDARIVMERVHRILEALVLSRSLFSQIRAVDGSIVSVADAVPPVRIYTQDLRLSADKHEAYKLREEALCVSFAEELIAHADDSVDSTTALMRMGLKFAKLLSLSTHIGFAGLDKHSTSRIRSMREEGLPLLVARMKAANALDPEDIDIPLDNEFEVLRQFLWGSPKMAFMLGEIQRVIFGDSKPEDKRKMFVTFQFSGSAEMFLKLVEYVGIRAVLLDSDMPADDIHRHIRAFDETDSVPILITTYAINMAGHDMQHRCCTVYHVEPAFNWATEHQYAARVCRIGQTSPTEVFRLFTEDSYQELHEFSMIKEANSRVAGFDELHTAVRELKNRETLSSEQLALGAFEIWRSRVTGRVNA